MAEVHYLVLGDYCLIAAEVLGTTPEQIARLPRIGLADSALAVPRSGFGDEDAYPTLIEKAAALIEHLARNHPLPDGNKRCAFLAAERFLAAMVGRSRASTPMPMPHGRADRGWRCGVHGNPGLVGESNSNLESQDRTDDRGGRRFEPAPRYRRQSLCCFATRTREAANNPTIAGLVYEMPLAFFGKQSLTGIGVSIGEA